MIDELKQNVDNYRKSRVSNLLAHIGGRVLEASKRGEVKYRVPKAELESKKDINAIILYFGNLGLTIHTIDDTVLLIWGSDEIIE